MRSSGWSSDVCSSDLFAWNGPCCCGGAGPQRLPGCGGRAGAATAGRNRGSDKTRGRPSRCSVGRHNPTRKLSFDRRASKGRSEEHTSELQSLMRISYAVFCLKKKKKKK